MEIPALASLHAWTYPKGLSSPSTTRYSVQMKISLADSSFKTLLVASGDPAIVTRPVLVSSAQNYKGIIIGHRLLENIFHDLAL